MRPSWFCDGTTPIRVPLPHFGTLGADLPERPPALSVSASGLAGSVEVSEGTDGGGHEGRVRARSLRSGWRMVVAPNGWAWWIGVQLVGEIARVAIAPITDCSRLVGGASPNELTRA